jgi:glycosyltransferase involved in cell wall biosynthesis
VRHPALSRTGHPLTRLLDITRLVRRAGRPMTGIDRVEFAYLRALSARDAPFFALARTRLGYVLLDHAGAREMARRLGEDDFGALDALGRLLRSRPAPVRRAEADLRRLCIARCLPQRLGAMLARHLPRGVRYINTGHANLTDRVLAGLRGRDARVAVMVHDVIPLEAPHWQRPGAADRFGRFLLQVERHADLVIYNSHDTRARSEAILRRAPASITAHLGVDSALPDLLPPALAAGLPPGRAYFVCLGTIEPRKNHALLLDLWDAWGATAPTLVLAGARGWNNAEIFARLDRGVAGVLEAPGLTDGQVSTLLDGSHGLLFPSHLEGFGLPPMEAALRGVPVLAQPLPVLREVMGDIPIYLDPAKPYLWRQEIEKMAEQRRHPPPFVPPSWSDHFNAVLKVT